MGGVSAHGAAAAAQRPADSRAGSSHPPADAPEGAAGAAAVDDNGRGTC
jgi:hypothetical protein